MRCNRARGEPLPIVASALRRSVFRNNKCPAPSAPWTCSFLSDVQSWQSMKWANLVVSTGYGYKEYSVIGHQIDTLHHRVCSVPTL